MTKVNNATTYGIVSVALAKVGSYLTTAVKLVRSDLGISLAGQ